jgi:hypothetical protein
MGKRTSSPRWHACNVLQSVPPQTRLWQYSVNSGGVTLSAQHEFAQDQAIPSKSIGRGWSELWRPRLNVAWLPADQVYLRVVHLPKGEPGELRPMLELQLEKLSPAPVNQVVWTFEPVPHPAPELQSAVVILAERQHVEAYLGGLEQQGYLADRLELPWLHWVLTGRPDTDQTCVYLVSRDQRVLCLTAWWYGAALQHLDLFQVDHQPAAPSGIADQLIRVAWAGEIEGWLTGPPRWRLTTAGDDLDAWVPSLRERLGGELETASAPPLGDLAQVAAQRGVRGEATANLLPAEFVTRFRQQFVDRLWMRGLGALILVYLFFVLLYFAGVQVLEHQVGRSQSELASLSGPYTNALQLKQRVQVFAEQAELKYAALNSLRVVSELLPTEITLTSFTFQGGRSLRLTGTVAPDQQGRVTEYNEELRNATVDGTPLFDKKKFEAPTIVAQGAASRWDFTADLNRVFTE